MLSVSDHNLQIPVVFGCVWMFLGHSIGRKLDPDPDHSRPHSGTFSTEPQAWKTIQSPRATWMQSDLPHRSGLQKRVSMRISGTK